MISVRSEFQSKELDGLNNLPSDWHICRLKHLFKIQNGATPKSDTSEFWDGDLIWVTPADISKLSSEYVRDSAKKITRAGLDSCGTTLVPEGTIVLSTRAPIGSICVAERNLCTNQGCKSLIPKNEVNSKFYYYYLRVSKDFLNLKGSGTTFLELPTYEMANFNAPLPTIDIQNHVVFFLDREVYRIEKLISEKQNFIKLLKEKRQALISHVVTKGLDPDVEMKDSGVTWIGNTPKSWSVAAIKRLTAVQRGASPRPIDDQVYFDENGEYAWTRIADVSKTDGELKETLQRLSSLGSSLSVKLEPESLFLSIAGTVGKPCITKIKACIHDGFVYFPTLRKVRTKFLFYVFLSGEPYKGLGKMGTQLNLNTETVGSIKISFPALKEQDEIVRYIEDRTRKINEIIAETTSSISLLNEHRTALISSAVTGKIDLRDKEVA
jgi:type I restriction enzyme S subunit